ncbi:MAG: amino acid adenylation domain-containing protein [Bacteroidia bacterium]
MKLTAVDFDPFVEIDSFISTSESQREILSSVKLGNDAANCAYNESLTIKLIGSFNYEALVKAANAVVKRHGSLRATFIDDGFKMRIASQLAIDVPLIDLGRIPEEQRDEHFKEIILEDVSAPFDLPNGPLFDVKVVRFIPGLHYVVITAHHVVCDGWSTGIIMQDLSKFYNMFAYNKEVELDAAHQYDEYIQSEIDFEQSEEYTKTEAFWLNLFKDYNHFFEMPVDKARPALRTYNAKRFDVAIDVETVTALKKTAAKNSCSFINTLIAAFEVYLYRVTQQTEIVLGLPSAGQSISDKYSLVGHCVNLLPLKTSIDGHLPFSTYLKERKKSLFDALENQRYTFGTLIKKLNVHRDPSRIPLVPVAFNADLGIADGVAFEGLEMEVMSNPRTFENFEIFLNATGQNGKLILECTYNTDLYDDELMQNRMHEFVRLLQSIVKNADEIIDEIDYLSHDELELLNRWNETFSTFPGEKCLHRLFEEQVIINPDAVALKFKNKTITYTKLNEDANRVARLLISKGLQSGDLVALSTDRSPEMVIAMLGIVKAGGAYLPVDPEFPAERIAYMLENSNVRYIVTEKSISNKFNFKCEHQLLTDKWETELPLINSKAPVVDCNSENLAYVLYTSGSTGKPKGVMIPHVALVNLLTAFQKIVNIGAADKMLALTTISFDIAELELFLPLISGATVVIASKEDAVDPRNIMQILADDQITFMQATPATWRMMVDSGWKGNNRLNILCGGEALPVLLSQSLTSGSKNVWNVYGPTETTIWSSTYKLPANYTNGSSQEAFVKIGKPIANTSFYILDKNLKRLPVGVEGDIYIGGIGLAKGYLNRPDLTEERFIIDPFDFTGLTFIYKTGDLGKFHKDGNIEYSGRSDFQVKVRGYRIELGEIENAIAQVPGVSALAVIAQPDRTHELQLEAYLTTDLKSNFKNPEDKKAANDMLINNIKKAIANKLPGYMIPSVFQVLDKMPHTANGKIDRKALPGINDKSKDINQEHMAPRTLTEKQITAIWEKLLNVSNISVHDNFFDLGGHSIIAVRMMIEIEKLKDMRLPLAVLFTNPTVEKLATVVDSEVEGDIWRSIAPIRTSGSKKPFFFAHGVSGNVFKYHALGQLLDADVPSYGLQAKGLNGIDTPFSDMDEMAEYHINEILRIQPYGPYYLGGGSFGGALAYEIACHLRQMGKEVAMVVLFDVEAATKSELLNGMEKQILELKLKSKRVVTRLKMLTNQSMDQKLAYLKNKIANPSHKENLLKEQMDEWLNKEFIAEKYGLASAAYFNNIEESCYKALKDYKLKEYDGEVLLLRAKNGFFSDIEYDEALGWGYFVKGKVDVEFVPGNHNSIFEYPHVPHLAAAMMKHINAHYSTRTHKV